MLTIMMDDTKVRFTLPTDQARRLITKNPSCTSTIADDRTTLEYKRDEIVALTSLLKYKRHPLS